MRRPSALTQCLCSASSVKGQLLQMLGEENWCFLPGTTGILWVYATLPGGKRETKYLVALAPQPCLSSAPGHLGKDAQETVTESHLPSVFPAAEGSLEIPPLLAESRSLSPAPGTPFMSEPSTPRRVSQIAQTWCLAFCWCLSPCCQQAGLHEVSPNPSLLGRKSPAQDQRENHCDGHI